MNINLENPAKTQKQPNVTTDHPRYPNSNTKKFIGAKKPNLFQIPMTFNQLQISTKSSPKLPKHDFKTKFTQTIIDFHKSKINEKDPKLFCL